jgi:actin-like ATPase involved in cell morphogenesis
VNASSSTTNTPIASLGIDVGSLNCHITRGANTTVVPSLVAAGPDDALVCGQHAARIAAVAPERVIGDLLARLEDPHMARVGGRRIAPEELLAALIDDVVGRSAGSDNRRAVQVGFTYPSRFAEHHVALVDRAARLSGLERVLLTPRPIAIARQLHVGAMSPTSTLIVDVGAQACELSIVDQSAQGVGELREGARTLMGLGGNDIDRLILEWVDRQLDGALLAGAGDNDGRDDGAAVAIAAALRDCRAAKESMTEVSSDVITVMAGASRHHLTLSRELLVALTESYVACLGVNVNEMIGALRRNARVSSVVLVGGGSQLFGLADALQAVANCDVFVADEPHLLASRGAALLSAGSTDSPALAGDQDNDDSGNGHRREVATRSTRRGSRHSRASGAISSRRRGLGAIGGVGLVAAVWMATSAAAAHRNNGAAQDGAVTSSTSVAATSPSTGSPASTSATSVTTVAGGAVAPIPVAATPVAPTTAQPVQIVLVPVPAPVPGPGQAASPPPPAPPAPPTRPTTTRPTPGSVTVLTTPPIAPTTTAPTAAPTTTAPPTSAAPTTAPPATAPPATAPPATAPPTDPVTSPTTEPASSSAPPTTDAPSSTSASSTNTEAPAESSSDPIPGARTN